MKKRSKRFSPSKFSEALVPILLVLLSTGLLAIIVLVGLAVAGLIPGS
jgi:hypothetical protein